jgi:histidine triad (HIT) family protein
MTDTGTSRAPTPKQRAYLDFIAGYVAKHGRAPAEAEMQAHFAVTPPSVHQMIVTLERRGFITRERGVPRSIRVVERIDPAARTCRFCAIVARKTPSHVVWTDDAHVAFLDVNPAARGHLLLIPRRHAATIYDLAPHEFTSIFEAVRRIGPRLAAALGADRTAIAVEGYGVAHVHVHLVPVTGGGQLDPCRQKPATERELRVVAAILRTGLVSVG